MSPSSMASSSALDSLVWFIGRMVNSHKLIRVRGIHTQVGNTRVHLKTHTYLLFGYHKIGFVCQVDTTKMSLTRVHDHLTNFTPNHHDGVGILQVFSSVLEHVAPHLRLSHVALLASCCKTLRLMVTEVGVLHYLLRFIHPLNAHDTRQRFLIPRSVPLCRVSQNRYSQTHGLEIAIRTHGDLHGFKTAWMERREKTKRRREKALKLRQDRHRRRLRRITLVQEGLATCGLGHVIPGLGRHRPYAMFIHDNLADVSPDREEFHLNIVIEHICWDYYLANYTNYIERIKERVEVMGNYPGLMRDIMSEFDRPDAWPWLE